MVSHAYRSVYEHMIGAKLAEREAAHEVASPWLPRLARIQRGRIARGLAGAVGIIGAAAMAVAAALGPGEEPTLILVASVLGMFATWVLAHLVLALASRRPRQERYVPPPLTGELKADLDRLETHDPVHALRAKLEKSECLSLDLFGIAICLLAPLSLHGVIAFCGGSTAKDFASWIRFSLLLVGHAHIALAVLTARYVKRLRLPPAEEGLPQFSVHREWGAAFGWTVGVTCLPGIMLFAIPPLISVVTGLAFIPILYVYLRSRSESERTIVALAISDVTPVAPTRIHESAAAYDAATAEPESAVEARQMVGR